PDVITNLPHHSQSWSVNSIVFEEDTDQQWGGQSCVKRKKFSEPFFAVDVHVSEKDGRQRSQVDEQAQEGCLPEPETERDDAIDGCYEKKQKDDTERPPELWKPAREVAKRQLDSLLRAKEDHRVDCDDCKRNIDGLAGNELARRILQHSHDTGQQPSPPPIGEGDDACERDKSGKTYKNHGLSV